MPKEKDKRAAKDKSGRDGGAPDPMTRVLATFRSPEATDFGNAWVGMEPTFQSEKSIRKWEKHAAEGDAGEAAYFEDDYMLETQRAVAKQIQKRYEAHREEGRDPCMFERVDVENDVDQWKVRRQNLVFKWGDRQHEDFEARWTLDPETFEWSIKPVPLAWFYDERFARFLQEYMWKVPEKHGLTTSIAHGGSQFSLSAKAFLTGSLLADDIAYKASHPELSTWIMDWPNCDDRAFRATRKRLNAFRAVLDAYWAGGFHPRANGVLTLENAYMDRGFGPAANPPKGLMTPRGPAGDAREVFQTNFAFGRAVRLQAQAVEPGYWQGAHPDADGYRPDQIMRYSEGNLNRLQVVGELHVKSGKTLQAERVPEYETPLETAMLTDEASWENRAQMSRTSARDFVEALLLDVHHAQYLQAHPQVRVADSILQDQLLLDGAATVRRHGGEDLLARMQAEARVVNAESSPGGRIKSDWIEPETLFWAAWRVLPAGERAAIATEVVTSFVARVEAAASVDPRPWKESDPMEWHRHRIHPLLWKALEEGGKRGKDVASREHAAWQAKREEYLARRPQWSQTGRDPPWHGL